MLGSPTIQKLGDEGPFPSLFQDTINQNIVLFNCPRSSGLNKVLPAFGGVQVVIPSFSTLFGCSKEFSVRFIENHFGDLIPSVLLRL